jgi:hypothetical protein
MPNREAVAETVRVFGCAVGLRPVLAATSVSVMCSLARTSGNLRTGLNTARTAAAVHKPGDHQANR